MKAATQLNVNDAMTVSLQIDMTVAEMKALLNRLNAESDGDTWACSALARVLRESLGKASAAYYSTHVHD